LRAKSPNFDSSEHLLKETQIVKYAYVYIYKYTVALVNFL
jgi:hypothetical protein